MQITGFLGFFSIFIPQLRVRTSFMTDKLKKGTPFSWTEADEKRFRDLLDHVLENHLKGMTILFDLSQQVQLYLYCDYCSERNCSAAVLLCKYRDDQGIVRVVPALAESRSLPSSYKGKSSLLGEAASLCFSLISLRQVVEFRPLLDPFSF